MERRGDFVVLKDDLWIKRQKHAGRVVAKSHQEIYPMIKGMSKGLTLKQIGEVVNEVIQKNDCTPTFLGYNGFPSVVCASINHELVHGFARDIELQPGDVVKIDIGATFEGAIGDCAVTYVYGKPKSEKILQMLLACQDSLRDAIAVVKPGNRLGEIGKAIWEKSRTSGFGVITDFGGHGIDYHKLHSHPFVKNKGKSDEGIVMEPGLSIAIEPMFVLGKNTNTKLLKDKWTVVTKDIGCHYEHSVTIDKNGHTHIMTDHDIDVKDFV